MRISSRFRPGRSRFANRRFQTFVILLLGVTACSSSDPSPSPPPQVHEASIPELQAAMEEGRTTAVALVHAHLGRIEAYEADGPTLNAFLHLDAERALDRAAALDREREEDGARSPLHGIPVVLKDNFDTADMPTTGGSIALEGSVPDVDATIVRRLREAGAIILGKTNLHEFAYGYTTVSSLGGKTRNPYDPTRNPGGSSGGSGAAVAASFAPLGWATDTCGSIRVPAAFNGLYGLRPTKGIGSTAGILPLALTQDVPGPLARTVVDLAIGLDATVAPDPDDPVTTELASADLPEFSQALREDALEGARIGVLVDFFDDVEAEPDVVEEVQAAAAELAELGAEVVDVEIPDLEELLLGTSVIPHEFREDFEAYLANRSSTPVRTLATIVEDTLHHEVVAGGLGASLGSPGRGSDEHEAALNRRAAVRELVLGAFDEEAVDAFLYPSVTRSPSALGESQSGVACALAAATDLPAMVVPAGATAEGLPVGFELLGLPLDDARLVGFAYAWEQAADRRLPPPSTPPLPLEP